MSHTPPANALGADLFWWRESPALHTTATIYARAYEGVAEEVSLHCVLFDDSGTQRAEWTIAMEGRRFCTIDSSRLREWVPTPAAVGCGVLVVYSCGRLASGTADARYLRLFSMVDWYSEAGGIAGLHNDQSIITGARRIALTEIAVLETDVSRNSLVFLNGATAQVAGSLRIVVANAGGAQREATYASAMAPFTVHQLRLGELFPGLAAFGAGDFLHVSGTFDCEGLYLRPYVITEGALFSAYHGGDVYQWDPFPALRYRLLGAGEVNPMAVLHRPGELETSVNFFNSHGDLEESFWVDVELFDEAGIRVARREKWRCARRNELVRADVEELLPEPSKPFTGHVALTFSSVDAAAYPGHLQALLEYRSNGRAARVMAWSDEWNSKEKQFVRAKSAPLAMRSYYRARVGRGFETFVSLTNAGHDGHRAAAAVVIRLINERGDELRCDCAIGAHATLFSSLASLLPSAEDFLAPSGVGIVEVESTFDLANVQFVRHAATATWSAEHYMPLVSRDGDHVVVPAGS